MLCLTDVVYLSHVFPPLIKRKDEACEDHVSLRKKNNEIRADAHTCEGSRETSRSHADGAKCSESNQREESGVHKVTWFKIFSIFALVKLITFDIFPN